MLAHASVAPRIFHCLDLPGTHVGSTQLESLLWLEKLSSNAIDCTYRTGGACLSQRGAFHGVSAFFRKPELVVPERGGGG